MYGMVSLSYYPSTKTGVRMKKKIYGNAHKFNLNELPTYVNCETILLIPRPPKFCKYIIY